MQFRPSIGLMETGLLLTAAIVLPIVSVSEFSEVLSPLLMRLPFHHCIYCLVSNGQPPDAPIIVGNLAVGIFATGWAAILGAVLCVEAPPTATLQLHDRLCRPHRNGNPVVFGADDCDSPGHLTPPVNDRLEELHMVSWKIGAAYLLLMAIIALGTSLWSRHVATGRCEQDGQELSPAVLCVDLEMADATHHHFCSVECARRWLAGQ